MIWQIEFESFLMGNILKEMPSDLVSAFDRLAPDVIDYRNTGFQSRYRCFSSYRIENCTVCLAPKLEPLFNGDRNFHVKNTEANRVPSPDTELVASGAIETFIAALVPAMPLQNIESFAIGINLVRVVANDTNMGSPAPRLHQDGYDFSCHVNVARHNVSGGASLLATSAQPVDVILEHALQPNEFVFFNDRKMFHTATPITQRITGEDTWRDMIIVDIVRLRDY